MANEFPIKHGIVVDGEGVPIGSFTNTITSPASDQKVPTEQATKNYVDNKVDTDALLKADYDTTSTGNKVDSALNADKVNGHTVNTDVPVGAVFTDTTYTITDGELSQNNFTNTLKTKLDDLDSAANKNVNADWNSASGDSEILNKPSEFTPSHHTHTEAGISNLDKYTQSEVDALVNAKSDSTHNHNLNDLNEKDYSSLDGIPTSADIKNMYEGENNTNAFTDDEKAKLAGLESSKFLGTFANTTDLSTAYPTPGLGSYAYIDAGIGQPVTSVIWDNDDSAWQDMGETSVETAASIKSKYESNADTNVLTDVNVSDLADLTSGANSSLHNHNGTYYTKTEIDSSLSNKTDAGHSHTESDISDLDKYSTTQIDSMMSLKAGTGHAHDFADITGKPSSYNPSAHSHTESDITDLDKYTTTQVDTMLAAKSSSSHNHNLNDLTEKSFNSLTDIPLTFMPSTHNHDSLYYSKSYLDTQLDNKADDNHMHNLNNLAEKDYSSLDNAPSSVLHFDILDIGSAKVITAAERTAIGNIAGKAESSHTHNKSDIGLGNVNDTSDVDKPISSATATALGNKVNKLSTTITDGIATFNNTTGDLKDSGTKISDLQTKLGYGNAAQVLSTNAAKDGYEWKDVTSSETKHWDYFKSGAISYSVVLPKNENAFIANGFLVPDDSREYRLKAISVSATRGQCNQATNINIRVAEMTSSNGTQYAVGGGTEKASEDLLTVGSAMATSYYVTDNTTLDVELTPNTFIFVDLVVNHWTFTDVATTLTIDVK